MGARRCRLTFGWITPGFLAANRRPGLQSSSRFVGPSSEIAEKFPQSSDRAAQLNTDRGVKPPHSFGDLTSGQSVGSEEAEDPLLLGRELLDGDEEPHLFLVPGKILARCCQTAGRQIFPSSSGVTSRRCLRVVFTRVF